MHLQSSPHSKQDSKILLLQRQMRIVLTALVSVQSMWLLQTQLDRCTEVRSERGQKVGRPNRSGAERGQKWANPTVEEPKGGRKWADSTAEEQKDGTKWATQLQRNRKRAKCGQTQLQIRVCRAVEL